MADATAASSGEKRPPVQEEEEGEWVGPMPMAPEEAAAAAAKPQAKRKKVLPHEQLFVDRLPEATMYETSYMHRDTITHVCVSKSDFIITASCDGHVKFWKKNVEEGITFVKHYRAHLGTIDGMAVSADGLFLATASNDKSLKLFDVVNFDMITMVKLDYTPSVVCWVHKHGAATPLVACSDKMDGAIRIYKADGASDQPTKTLNIHYAPVTAIEYNPVFDVTISSDESGMLEYWGGVDIDFDFPKNVNFEYKTDTDLYELAKCKAQPLHLSVSPDGRLFVVGASDRKVSSHEPGTPAASPPLPSEEARQASATPLLTMGYANVAGASVQVSRRQDFAHLRRVHPVLHREAACE